MTKLRAHPFCICENTNHQVNKHAHDWIYEKVVCN